MYNYLPLSLINENTFFCQPKNLVLVINFLKKHIKSKYTQIVDIVAVDLVNNEYQFLVIYNLLSIMYNKRISIKTLVKKNEKIASITSIFAASNWLEREIWDMFGIYFNNHPDLRRILNDYNFEGFPLTKDFPVTGFYDLRYSETLKMITFDALSLNQQNRFH